MSLSGLMQSVYTHVINYHNKHSLILKLFFNIFPKGYELHFMLLQNFHVRFLVAQKKNIIIITLIMGHNSFQARIKRALHKLVSSV